ncbi:pyridoxal phosphate-dependent decarboxylase family protein [Pengzhenrongella sicca]|uniref:Aminotransferase class V-fold PLP-dependent enzyme n=1 Tax=Pengzhenrongella sicca TaxID=2819238 RepID=A0A8A4ZDW8_9MICO|nr:aminotransferase class V-fold PLP-dependent enzyme [Pengzhenrongella sicca]QTE28746.1 aminotransferase class V-fold PLP-dependent enzyme [Pengzhenrongella sicca]
MTERYESYAGALERASAYARDWLTGLPDRPIGPRVAADALLADLAGALPAGPTDPADVVDLLAAAVEPGLMAIGSGRFFGWVMGGTLPAALAADWLVSAWDQNAGMRYSTPGVVAAEEAAGAWLLDLLGLPAGADVGFVTGATMANFTGLAAGRQQVLTDAGWDLDTLGLTGAPRVRVLAGAERHDSVDLALRYLGLGAPSLVPADDQGRIRLDALDDALAAGAGPTIVCLQAGNVHSGAFDPIGPAAALAHAHGAWVHVDGAFGLWAAASPALRGLLAGYAAADSWATDAHKTLNVPYDCGIAIVARPAPLRAALGVHASYLMPADPGPGDPFERVPEFSRRARGVPVWAALRSLGRAGVADLVDGLARNARALAAGMAGIEGARVLNDVVYTQVSVAFEDDARTRDVVARLLAGGTTWMSGSRWQARDIMRISVSNFATDDADVAASVEAVRRAAQASQNEQGRQREDTGQPDRNGQKSRAPESSTPRIAS